MAPELNFDSRAFSPVDGFHFNGFNTGECSAAIAARSISLMGYTGLLPKVIRLHWLAFWDCGRCFQFISEAGESLLLEYNGMVNIR